MDLEAICHYVGKEKRKEKRDRSNYWGRESNASQLWPLAIAGRAADRCR